MMSPRSTVTPERSATAVRTDTHTQTCWSLSWRSFLQKALDLCSSKAQRAYYCSNRWMPPSGRERVAELGACLLSLVLDIKSAVLKSRFEMPQQPFMCTERIANYAGGLKLPLVGTPLATAGSAFVAAAGLHGRSGGPALREHAHDHFRHGGADHLLPPRVQADHRAGCQREGAVRVAVCM